MKEYNLSYKNSRIHYCIFGTGKKILFCFHGYNKDGNSFAFLKHALGGDYTLICIDLPFHGKTVWNEDLNFTENDIIKIISLINGSINQPINLLGYSMGGRVVLQLLQKIPQKIERVVLVATDGLHKNFWYYLTTQTVIGNKIFKYSMHNPAWLFRLMKTAQQLKLINENMLSIAHYYLNIESERMLLYERWTTMRKFKPNLHQLQLIIKKNKIPVRFLFGKYDQIILSKRSDFLKEDVSDIQTHIINAGHRLMQEKYANYIAKLFY
ncbi:MAG: alpha/beta fold hydrolase [Chitinophagaceae bacterium]